MLRESSARRTPVSKRENNYDVCNNSKSYSQKRRSGDKAHLCEARRTRRGIFSAAQYGKCVFRYQAEFLPEKELLGGCEAVITVGGDGTIIHSAKKAAVYSKPVLGINAGRLAFMAGLEIHELDLLEKLITGDYSMDKRMMLKTTAADGDSVQSGYSMNDSTVMRLSRLSRISEINVDLDGRYFNRYLGDGSFSRLRPVQRHIRSLPAVPWLIRSLNV